MNLPSFRRVRLLLATNHNQRTKSRLSLVSKPKSVGAEIYRKPVGLSGEGEWYLKRRASPRTGRVTCKIESSTLSRSMSLVACPPKITSPTTQARLAFPSPLKLTSIYSSFRNPSLSYRLAGVPHTLPSTPTPINPNPLPCGLVNLPSRDLSFPPPP